jgi:hypothetical protein
VMDEWDHNKNFQVVDLCLHCADGCHVRLHPNSKNRHSVRFGRFAGTGDAGYRLWRESSEPPSAVELVPRAPAPHAGAMLAALEDGTPPATAAPMPAGNLVPTKAPPVLERPREAQQPDSSCHSWQDGGVPPPTVELVPPTPAPHAGAILATPRAQGASQGKLSPQQQKQLLGPPVPTVPLIAANLPAKAPPTPDEWSHRAVLGHNPLPAKAALLPAVWKKAPPPKFGRSLEESSTRAGPGEDRAEAS